ncbi:MAG TPA: glycerophosphodiester phosphodiesterase family protein [Actinomycetota bacterium]
MRIRTLLCLLPVAAATLQAVPAAASPVTVYAHRGGASIAPENTMAAFENAAALFAGAGVDGWLEMDTQATADGALVLIHDDTLDRTTTCAGPVIDWTYSATECDAAKRWRPSFGFEPVPLLADVLARGMQASPAWGVMIEIKDIPGETNFDPAGTLVADALVALIGSSGYPKDRIIVQSFWPPALDRVELLDPALDTMLLTTSDLGFLLTENAVYATARGYEISAPDFEAADFTAEGVAAAHLLGRRVITWTVDSAADAARMIALGVDGVITNDPRILL